MLKIKQLCKYLDQLLPSDKITDYGPNGLQVEGKENVSRLVTGVSASLSTIEAAIEAKADVLIVHHGLFWQRDSYVIQGIKKQKLARLLETGLSLLAYHLPLDAHTEVGNNWRAAKEMGWKNLQPFGYFNGFPIGVKGEIHPTDQEELKKQLENYYQHSAICALGGPKTIKTIGLISGGAYKSIQEAIDEKLDAFVTGSFDEPVWFQAFEEKINFFALGHSATEKVGPRALAVHLKQELSLPCTFIDIPNPF